MTPSFAFLHGGGQGGWVWEEVIAALDRQTGGRYGRTLALDVPPGCGAKRGRDTSGLDVDDIASELIADLEHRDRWPDQSMQASDWRYDHLRNLPSTFVLCLQDGILTPPWQERFAQRLNTQRMVRIDAGHQVMNTRPHALAELLRHETSIG